MKPYVLTSDDDGHWYVVAVCDLNKFHSRIKYELYFDDLDITAVGGSPTLVHFSNWKIQDGKQHGNDRTSGV